MNTTNYRALIVGLRADEQEEIRLWAAAHDHEVWFAMNGVEALRVFEEVKPALIVLDSLLGDVDAERLGRIFHSTSDAITTVFVTSHSAETRYYGGLRDLGAVRCCHRPVDPEVVFDRIREEGRIGAVPDRGVVEPVALGRLFLEILAQRSTGVLYAGTGAFRKVVYFREGRPHYATSTVLDENFGHFLLRKALIRQVDFNCARNLQLREGIRQGEALVKLGVLDESRLSTLLNAQIREKIVNTFSLEGMPFHFDAYGAAVLQPRHTYSTVELLVDALGEMQNDVAVADTRFEPAAPMGPTLRSDLARVAGDGFVTALVRGASGSELVALSPTMGESLLRTLLALGLARPNVPDDQPTKRFVDSSRASLARVAAH